MDFLELAKNRYSSRKYLDKAVEEHKLEIILEAARIAPSAANYQPWYFVVFKEADELKKIGECYHRPWFKTAPVVLVACANHQQSWKRKDAKDHADIDLAIAIDHITLAATSLDLATCWICNFDVDKTRQLLELPDYIEPVALIPIAYPADNSDNERHNKLRKPMNEIVGFGKFKIEVYK